MIALSSFTKTPVTIITVNPRLTRDIQRRYDQEQINQKQFAWKSLDVLPLAKWLERCWYEVDDSRIILSTFQEKLVWQLIIETSGENYLLSHGGITAQYVMQTWHLLHQWDLSLEKIEAVAFTQDVHLFLKWAKEFKKYCQQKNWITQSELGTELLPHLAKTHFSSPLLFFGFLHLFPQLEKLIFHLKQQIKVDFLDETFKVKHEVHKLICQDFEQELYTIARFAKEQLLKNSQITLGCVIPHLPQVRDQVERVFTEVLFPDYFHPDFKHPAPLFNMTAGKSLSSYPLIKDALAILKLYQPNLNTTEIGSWLLSPFIGGADQELTNRAMLDRRLLNDSEAWITLRSVIALARQKISDFTDSHCPLLVNQLQSYLNLIKQAPQRQSLSDWSVFFQQQLQNMGWPGERTLNSHEYQTWQRWQEMLEEYAGLDILFNEVDLSSAVKIMEQLASSIIFQPRTADVPIQILTPQEAIGLSFDYFWALGIDDEVWPPRAKPNAFLPLELQRQLGMTHASAESQLQFYDKLTQHFCENNTRIVFTCHRQEEGQTLRPSSLLKNYPEITLMDLNLPEFSRIDEQLFNTSEMEAFVDERAPALQPQEILQGGTGIFKDQAACPFRAYAKRRLHASSFELPHYGLDNKERGNLLHKALYHVWNEIDNQQQLLQLTDHSLEKTIMYAIDAALIELIPKKPLTMKTYFCDIEKQRLKKLLLAWLNYEKNRKPFRVLLKEQAQMHQWNNIPLHIRIDRIDQLNDGSYIIIDYKTSETSIDRWFSERPEEPQLPLYYLVSTLPVSGISFAEIHLEKIRFNGITVQADYLPNVLALSELKDDDIPKEWPALSKEWHKTLNKISDEFSSGYAKVDPKNIKETCKNCDLQTLCRIHERQEKYV